MDEQGILDRDYSWSIVILNFEFLLILNHDDVPWDCPTREDLRKKRRIFLGTHSLKKKYTDTIYWDENDKCVWNLFSFSPKIP